MRRRANIYVRPYSLYCSLYFSFVHMTAILCVNKVNDDDHDGHYELIPPIIMHRAGFNMGAGQLLWGPLCEIPKVKTLTLKHIYKEWWASSMGANSTTLHCHYHCLFCSLQQRSHKFQLGARLPISFSVPLFLPFTPPSLFLSFLFPFSFKSIGPPIIRLGGLGSAL